MHFTFFSSLTAVILASSGATVSAQSPLPPPQFTAILTVQLNKTARLSTVGPFGTRKHVEASGGDLLNATTGEVVGTVLSFSGNGLITDSGLTFPSSIMPLIWSDGHFASVSMNAGVGGGSNSDIVYSSAHVETDSPTYSWMNGKFLLMQAGLSSLSFTIYEERR